MALRNDFTSFLGEDVVLQVTLNPVPSGGIAGYTFAFTSRLPITNSSVFVEKADAAFSIVDAALGIFSVPLLDTDTDTDAGGATAGDYSYDIKRMDDGSESILVWGTWTLANTPTRDVE